MQVRDLTNDYRWRLGIENWRHDKNAFIDDRLVTPEDTTTFKKHMSNFNYAFKNPSSNCMYTPFWCRDQNFRKYFEIRKRHGIKPSVNVSGYYNKDKAVAYWDGLIQGQELLRDVDKVK